MAAARTTMNVCLTARTQCQCLVWSADSDDSRNPSVDVGLYDSSSDDSISRCECLQCRPTARQKLSRWNMSFSNNWLKTARFNGLLSDSSQSMSPLQCLDNQWMSMSIQTQTWRESHTHRCVSQRQVCSETGSRGQWPTKASTRVINEAIAELVTMTDRRIGNVA